jgi:hypothetical protein
MNKFPYGEIFDTDRWSLGSRIMCVDKAALQRIVEHDDDLPQLEWQELTDCCWTERRSNSGLVSLVINRRHDIGWHARISVGGMASGNLHYLCYALTINPVVFPSAKLAKIAAEIFSSGQHWEVAPMVWVGEEGDYWFPEEEQASTH